MDNKTKCFSVNLGPEEAEKLRVVKDKTAKSQSQVLREAVAQGLNNAAFLVQGASLFLVRVRIDLEQMMELGRKLQHNELKTDQILFTYCHKEDPAVGVSLWIAKGRKQFDGLFAPHKPYYKEVIEITEVVTAEESMRLLMAGR